MLLAFSRDVEPIHLVFYKNQGRHLSLNSNHLINNKPKMSAITYTQHPLVLPSLGRGSHLITPFIQSSLKKEIDGIQCGLLHLFVQHTSCALSLNENCDGDVRKDMSDALDKIVVEDKVRNLPSLFLFFFSLLSLAPTPESCPR